MEPAGITGVCVHLLAVALTVGLRYFGRDFLEAAFREEMEMLKGTGFIEERIEEGFVRGEALGMALGARRYLLRQLRKRFGELPDAVVARVNDADYSWCEDLAERILDADSLGDLGLSEAAEDKPSGGGMAK